MSWRNRSGYSYNRNYSQINEKFYSCQYAKSGRSECKSCNVKIEKGELRLAIHVQIQSFDGVTPNWYHFSCFFNTTYLLKSVDKLRGYDILRWSDQQRLLERLGRNDANIVVIKPEPVRQAIDPALLSLEYASHGRYKCTKCKTKILKGSCIVHKKPNVTSKRSDKMHLECYGREETNDKVIEFEAEDIDGYNSLKPVDQAKIIEFINAVKSSNAKRKRDRDEEESDAKRQRTSIHTKLHEQNERFWSIRDSVNKLTMKLIKDIIAQNNQSIQDVKGHDDIVNFCADIMCFGPLQPCPTCKGQLILKSNRYICTGNLSEWTKCIYKTQEPNRRSYLLLPPKTRNKFLKGFTFRPRQRLFLIPLEKSTIESIEAKSSKNAKSTYQRMERDTSNIVGGGRVDPKSGFENSGHVELDENNDHYSCALSLVNILAGVNSFYKMQLIKHDSSNSWNVFRSWGRLGTEIGEKKLTRYESKSEALKEFYRIFKEKTGFDWQVRKVSEKKPNKYYFLEMEKCYENRDIENKIRAAEKLCDKNFVSESNLPIEIQSLVKQIFNVENMKYQMRRFNIDVDKMPLGKVSSNQIKKAYSILAELTSLLETNGDKALILDASNKFYSIIPHYFGEESPRLLDDPNLIKEKLDMLDSLTEIEVAYKLMKAKYENESDLNKNIDPIDFHFNQLNCQMDVVDCECDEFKLLNSYVTNTHSKEHSFKLKLENVFKVKRNGEDEIYSKYKSLHNKRLLFHGSRVTNFASILSQGLKIAPKEAPSNGYMFGKGVYFADMVTKSAQYCNVDSNSNGLILLCEVALGNMFERLAATGIKQLPDNKNSTYGHGKLMPDPNMSHKTDDGVEIPLGTPIENTELKTSLLHNEFIVYDVAQINIKYLLRVNFDYSKDN